VVNQELVTISLGAENGGLLLDLSTGGAAVQSVSPLKRGATSPFVFQLPKVESPIEGTGVFVWVDGNERAGGLRFDKLSPKARQLVEQWLKDIPTDEEAPPEKVDEMVAESGMQKAAAPVVVRAIPAEARDSALEAKLVRMAERARIISRAKGASIALKDEQGAFQCKAIAGIMAPTVGMPVNLERGLAAECVASKEVVVCNEAQDDARVDVMTREQLSLGSAALLPLFARGTVCGLLGVFSDRAHAFGEAEINRLQDCARTIENTVGRHQPVVTAAEIEVSPDAAPAIVPQAEPAAVLQKKSTRETNLATSAARISTGVILGSMILFSGLMLYQRYMLAGRRSPTVVSQPAASKAVPNAAEAIPSTEVRPETLAVAPTAVQKPAEREVRKQSPAQTAKPVEAEIPTDRTAVHATLRSPGADKTPEVPPVVTRQTAPAAAPPIVNDAAVPNPPSKQQNEIRQAAVPLVRAPEVVAPAPTPHVDVLTTVLEITPKSRTTNTPQLSSPELTSRVDIAYPAAALAQNRQGSVVLRVSVGRKGNVENIRVLDGDRALTDEAVRVVRQWRYKPFKVAGREVGADLLVTVNFVLRP
jgi:TonB family protein